MHGHLGGTDRLFVCLPQSILPLPIPSRETESSLWYEMDDHIRDASMRGQSTVGANTPQRTDAFIATSLRRPTHKLLDDSTSGWTETVGSGSCSIDIPHRVASRSRLRDIFYQLLDERDQ